MVGTAGWSHDRRALTRRLRFAHFSALLLILLTASFLMHSAVSAQSERVYVESAEAYVGETVSVALLASGLDERGLGAWTIDVSHRPDLLGIQTCEPGPGGFCNPTYHDGTARVAGAVGEPLTGDPIQLAEITFRCLVEGIFVVDVRIATLADGTPGDPQPISLLPENGNVNCSLPPVFPSEGAIPTAAAAGAASENGGLPTDRESGGGLSAAWIAAAAGGGAIVLVGGGGLAAGRVMLRRRPSQEPTGRARIEAPISDVHTVLFTDMQSSTALGQRLGDAAVHELRRTHDEIVRSALAEHSGIEIKHTGDGIMASFSTASSALEAAIAIQRGVADHKHQHPDSPLAVYAGLNAGEPIAESGDLYGTAINLASRICDHAQPGQILAADVVRQLAAGKQFLFSDQGHVPLRGFDDPVKLWEVSWSHPQ